MYLLNRHNQFDLFILLCTSLLVAPVLSSNGETVDFSREIQPIFTQHCVKCHGADRQENGLRLDNEAGISDALDSGWLILPKTPSESELYRRISLSQDDPDIMPPLDEGAKLTPMQIRLIHRWITDGAHLDDHTTRKGHTADDLSAILPAPVSAVNALRKLGAFVTPVFQGTHALYVDLRLTSDQVGDTHLESLAPVAEQLRELNLAQTQITDDGLKHLKELKYLTHLHLENTGIGDTGLEHLEGLSNLTYLNLYGTNVSDAGLEILAQFADLEQLFVSQTKVSSPGIRQLQERRPDLGIEYVLEPAHAIGWSAHQLAAWQTVVKVWEFYDHRTWDKTAEHFHENWIGWFDRLPAPVDQNQWRQSIEADTKAFDFPLWRVTPQSINVIDDVAVIHSTYYLTSVDKTTGQTSAEEGKRIDTLKKADKAWKLIDSTGIAD